MLMKRGVLWSVVAAAVVVGLIAAYLALTGWSKARVTADDHSRTLALRDLVNQIQRAGDEDMGGGASRAAMLDKMRAIVAHPGSRATLSTGEVPTYELIWDGGQLKTQDLATTVLVREAAPTRDGRRAVAYANGVVAIVDG